MRLSFVALRRLASAEMQRFSHVETAYLAPAPIFDPGPKQQKVDRDRRKNRGRGIFMRAKACLPEYEPGAGEIEEQREKISQPQGDRSGGNLRIQSQTVQ